MFNDYEEFQDQVLAWLDLRPEARFDIPGLIHTAETKLRRRVSPPLLEERSTAEIDQGAAALPEDFRYARRVLISGRKHPLRQLSPHEFERRFGDRPQGEPEAFTLIRGEIYFAPEPDSLVTVELVYQRDEPRLSEANPTNFYLERMPDALLYGTLCEAGLYFSDPRYPVWSERYEKAVADYQLEAQRAAYQGGRIKMQPRRGIR